MPALQYNTVIDITMPLEGDVLTFSEEEKYKESFLFSIEKGDKYNVKKITLSTHTGTHIDAPKHFFNELASIDQIDLKNLILPICIIEVKNKTKITYNDLIDREISETVKGIIFKTDNSDYLSANKFNENYTYLDNSVFDFVREKKLQLIGIDYLSIEKYDENEFELHKNLLKNNILILENVNLSNVEPGEYLFICMPLLIKNGDGSPCRAILLK